MPLADDLSRGTDWPPADHRHRIERQLSHGLLYRNDPAELTAAYPELQSRSRAPEELVPYPSPRIVARTYASFLFGEDVALTHDDPAVSAAADAFAVANGLPALGAEAATTQAIHGEVYLRPSWSTRVDPDHAVLDAVPGARAIPEFAFGRLVEVVFVTTWRLSRSDDYLRHLEYHEPGAIRHRLFRGTSTNLGTPVSLGAYRHTRHLADDATLEAAGTELGLDTGVERLLPVHVPLGRDAESPHGDGALVGSEPLVLALHRLYTQEQHDAELARRRVAVTRAALGLAPGAARGPSFDRDRDLFVLDDVAAGPVGAEGSPVTPIEFGDDSVMRDRIRSRLGDLLIAAGISPHSVLPEEVGSAISGTARRLAQSLTVSTIAMAARYWQRGLSDAIGGALRLEAARALGAAPDSAVLDAIAGDPVTATLADGMVDDPVELAQMIEQYANAEAMSVRSRVRRVNPSWTDEEVDTEVDRIVSGREEPGPPAGGLDLPLDALEADDAEADELS